MARNLGSVPQDKDEAVTHTVNWTKDLNGGSISTVTWTVQGMNTQSETNTTTTASVRLAGGIPGETHTISCFITTSLGENKEIEFDVEIND